MGALCADGEAAVATVIAGTEDVAGVRKDRGLDDDDEVGVEDEGVDDVALHSAGVGATQEH